MTLEAVRGHLAAFNARDVDAVVAGFAQDAVFVAGDRQVVGQRAIREVFADAFAAPIRAELALRHAVVDGPTAACELVETLRLEDGSRHEIDVAAFYTVDGDQLARVRVYRDLTEPG